MKKIALIQSHCNNDEKLNILRENIQKLRDVNLDILLFSHITIPQDIIQSVDYFVYDKSNPILWNERRNINWWANSKVRLESSVPDYGWTVFNQIIKSYNVTIDQNYEMYFIVCYDLIIDEFVFDVINNNKVGKYKHVKPKNVNEVGVYTDVIFDTSLIFLSLTKDLIEEILSDLSKNEYIENPQWIAEKYLEVVIERNNILIENLGSVGDLFHESESVFNQSKNPNYEIFVDNQDLIKLRYFKKNLEVNHYLIINNDVITIDNEEFILDQNIEHAKSFGVFVDGSYNDLTHLLKSDKKINKVFLINQ